MKLKIFTESKTKFPKSKIIKLFNNITTEIMDNNAEGWVNIVFTTDKEIRVLNKKYLDLDKPTDVLSFNIEPPDDEDSVLGEIYISVAMASKQAKKHRITLENEYLRLFCHGLLHLLGYDHHKKKDLKRMKEYEDYYLGNL